MAVDSKRIVYGADQGANDVVKFSPDGKVISTIGPNLLIAKLQARGRLESAPQLERTFRRPRLRS